MKKVKILFLTCLTGIVSVIVTQVLVSCASEDGPLDSSNKQETSYEYEQLSEELNDYISQFVVSHPTTAPSRGFFGRLWRAFKADIFVTCRKDIRGWETTTGISPSASSAAWAQEGHTMIEYSSLSAEAKLTVDNMIAELRSELQENGVDLGILHNAAILTLITKDQLQGSNIQELTTNTFSALAELGVDVSNVDLAGAANEVEIFMRDIYDSDDDVLCAKFIAKYPESKDELLVVKKYCDTATKLLTDKDIVEFTDGYKTIIDNSKIDNSSKFSLRQTLTIAPASAELWNSIETLN